MKLTWRVQPGVELVRMRLLRCSRQLSRLLLPTLERPANATSTSVGGGNWSAAVAPAWKLAETMRGSARAGEAVTARVLRRGTSPRQASAQGAADRREFLALQELCHHQETDPEDDSAEQTRKHAGQPVCILGGWQASSRVQTQSAGGACRDEALQRRGEDLAGVELVEALFQEDPQEQHLGATGAGDGEADTHVAQGALEQYGE